MEKLETVKKKYAKILEEERLEDLEAELEKEIIINEIPFPNINKIEKYYTNNFVSEKEQVENVDFIEKILNVEDGLKWLQNKYGLLVEGHTSIVWCVAITHNNKSIVSGGGDSTIRIWDLQEKRQKTNLRGHTNYVVSVQLITTTITSSLDHTIKQ